MDNFPRAVAIILELEGGSKLVTDTGGLTRFGISSRSYPSLDIKSLTEALAIEIYRKDYWTPAKCDTMPWPMCLYVFDCAVNQGLTAARKLQYATFARAESPTPDEYLARRSERYKITANYDKYGKGWENRLVNLKKAADANG